MKTTIGLDMEEISRIETLLSKNSLFLSKYFSDNERKEFSLKEGKALCQTVTGAFCAKEAFVKALGTGFVKCKPADIEVLHNEQGKPYIELAGNLKSINDKIITDVSITHTDSYASAVVLMTFIDDA